MGTTYTYGKHIFDEKNYSVAAYFLDIVAGFYEDPDVVSMLEEIDKQTN